MPMPSTSQELYCNVFAPWRLHIAIQFNLLAISKTHFVLPFSTVFRLNFPSILVLKPAHEFERNCGLVGIMMIALGGEEFLKNIHNFTIVGDYGNFSRIQIIDTLSTH
jgi:hypothetical protein